MVQDPSFPSDDALPAWMCEAETQVILAANAAATTLVGFDEAELRGRRLEALLSPDQPATLAQRAFPALDDPVMAGRWRLLRKDGLESLVDIASGPSLQDGRRVRIVFALETDGGTVTQDLVGGLFRRAQQHLVLISLAREAAAPCRDLRSLLGRMIRASALALEGQRLSVWMKTAGRTLRKVASSEELDPGKLDPDPRQATHARLEIPLPIDGAWSGLLRCSRFDGVRGWTAGDRQFLEAVASMAALAVERQFRPSGVRELREVLQRALAGTVSDVLGTMDPRSDAPAASSERDQDRLIREVLRSTGGNRTAAAKLLGISRVTLWKRLKDLPEGAGSQTAAK